MLSVIPMYVAIMLKRLQEAKDAAVIASKEKSRFLANISHEIRTPLNAIVGFSSMLGKVDDQARQKQMMNHINDASESLMALVEGVLDFSRIESGKVKIKMARMDIRALLESIEGIFSLQAGEKGIQYRTYVDDAIPCRVMSDVQRLRQVLVNLVGNSVKFTDRGRVDITAKPVTVQDNRKMIRFDVTDTGPGISREFQGNIFERFRQEDDTAQRQHAGTGLGTAIAKNLVELMGGEIGVESRYGEGSRFWFTIELHECQPDEAAATTAVTAQRSSAACHASVPFRVLVTEDSEINRYVYLAMYRYLGVEVDFAENGVTALQKLAEDRFGLMILDMQMPEMSGIDVLKKYHASTRESDRIPVAVITGDATEDICRRCEQLGVKSFLAKPVGIDRMRDLIQHYIGQAEDRLVSSQ